MTKTNDEALRAALDPGELSQVARRIASAIDEAHRQPAEGQPRSIVFRVGQQRCALPLTSVREVVMPQPLSRVPRAPEAVLGIMNLRGRVIAVVDLVMGLSGELGRQAQGAGLLPAQARLRTGRILLLERGRKEIGLLVNEVVGIEPLGETTQTLEPATLARSIDALMD